MRALLLAPLLLLAGCGFTSQGDFARDTAAAKGAEAYDAGLENAMWFMCKAASHGSVERKFGTTHELATAYNTLCGYVGDSTTLVVD